MSSLPSYIARRLLQLIPVVMVIVLMTLSLIHI